MVYDPKEAAGEDVINSFSGEYAFLSNFYDSDVVYKGWLYQTAEHAYQTQKTTNNFDKMVIYDAPTPGQAKEMTRHMQIRPDWDLVKLAIMTEIVQNKFSRHPDLAAKLAATYPRELVEGNWWRDTYWGVFKGQGENHMGKILMEVRKQYLPPEGLSSAFSLHIPMSQDRVIRDEGPIRSLLNSVVFLYLHEADAAARYGAGHVPYGGDREGHVRAIAYNLGLAKGLYDGLETNDQFLFQARYPARANILLELSNGDRKYFTIMSPANDHTMAAAQLEWDEWDREGGFPTSLSATEWARKILPNYQAVEYTLKPGEATMVPHDRDGYRDYTVTLPRTRKSGWTPGQIIGGIFKQR